MKFKSGQILRNASVNEVITVNWIIGLDEVDDKIEVESR